MENKRKDTFLGLMLVGFACLIIPIFVKVSWVSRIKPLGYVIMFFATIYLIAGDKILNLFNRKRYKDKSPEEIAKIKEQEFEQQKKEMDYKLELEKRKVEIDIMKAKAENLRNSNTKTKDKFPDILGNLSPMFNNKPKQEFKEQRKQTNYKVHKDPDYELEKKIAEIEIMKAKAEKIRSSYKKQNNKPKKIKKQHYEQKKEDTFDSLREMF